MPKIEQLDWNKLKPKVADKIVYTKEKPLGYKRYDENFIKPKKKKKLSFKAKDKTLYKEYIEQTNHLKSIINGQ